MCKKLCFLISFILVLGAAFSNIASGADTSLVGWWKLDDANGTTFVDSSGNGYNGTITNQNTNPVKWTDSGYKGRALSFTSKTNTPFNLCDAPITLNMGEATSSFWMNMPTSFGAWGPIFVLVSGTYDHDIEPDGAGILWVNCEGGSAPSSWWGGTPPKPNLNDNQWHHVVVTYSFSNNIAVFYIDGKSIANVVHPYQDDITTVRLGGPRSTGRRQWRSYGGRLDEVSVYSKALSATEVQSLFWYGPEWALFATSPNPADGVTVSAANVTLGWTAGSSAASANGHRVYLDIDKQKVINRVGCEVNNVTTTNPSYSIPNPVQSGKTYYWAVDEVNGVNIWRGAVWSFGYSQKAFNPIPASGTKLVDPNIILSWTTGAGATSHKVYLGTNPGSLSLVSTQTATTYDPSPSSSLNYKTTYYWRIDEVNGASTYQGDVWNFKTTPHIQITDPTLVGWYNFNEDEDSIVIDWSGSGNHSLQVNGQPLHVAGHDANAMQFDGVDDSVEVTDMVQNDFTLMAWIKTTTLGPEGTMGRDGSGLIWADYSGGGDHFILAVLGTKLSFDTGAAPTVNTISNRDVVTGDWVHVAATRTQSSGQIELFIDAASDITATHTTRALGGSAKIAIGANLIDSRYFTGLIDEVRIYNRVLTAGEIGAIVAPLQAWLPNPPNNATNAATTPTLSWNLGAKAAEHDVYASDKFDEVNDANTSSPLTIYRGRQGTNEYDITTPLKWGQTYYWRIDEVNEPNVWRGNIWRFTVRNYLVVDDFEGYTNSDPNIIYKIWKDGVGYSPGNGTGSQVGYRDPNYAEVTIVHEGRQSMPFDYNNLKLPYYSDANRTFDTPQNWVTITSGPYTYHPKSLTLWFRGYPVSVGSFVESPAGTYTIATSGANIGDVSPTRGGGFHDECHFGYKAATSGTTTTLPGTTTSITGVKIIAKVESLGNTGDTVGKAGVMIRDSLDAKSVNGFMCVRRIAADTYGVAFQYRQTAKGGSTTQDVNDEGITLPCWVALTLQTGSSYRNVRAYYSKNGTTWLQLGTVQQYPSGTMYLPKAGSAPIYLGLAETSQSTTETRKAKFSNVAITAGAAGAWNHQDIGIKSNVASPLYVTLQDSNPSPGTKTVTHPDPYIVLQNTWQAWDIALSDFNGVDLTKIKKMTIGVGNKSAPQAVGIGTIYVDDIRLYVPRCIAGRVAPDFTGSDCLVDNQDLRILTDNWLISDYQVKPATSWDPNTDPNLEAWYKFDNNLNDSTTHHYNGDPCGTTPGYVAGKAGQAFSLDGIDDRSVVTRMVQDDFTLMAWIKTATPGAQAGTRAWQGSGLIWSDVAGSANDFILAVLGAKLSFGTGPTEQDTTSSGNIVTGQWVHVAVTRTLSSGRIEFFIDGILDTTVIHSNTGSLNGNPKITIGANTIDERYYTGLIDDVRIYSRVLSPSEIALLAGKTAPFTQPLSGLLTQREPAINMYPDSAIDLKDYARLAKVWLETLLWP
jgi:hypothetical protein